jgi:hypothetical protein
MKPAGAEQGAANAPLTRMPAQRAVVDQVANQQTCRVFILVSLAADDT